MKKFHFFFTALLVCLSLNLSQAEPLLRGHSYPQKHFSTKAKCQKCKKAPKKKTLTDTERKEQIEAAQKQNARLIQKNTENVQRFQEIRQAEAKTRP